MKRVRELIQNVEDGHEAENIKEIKKLLMEEPGMFAIVARSTSNFYLGAENGAACAYVFTGSEEAEVFARNVRDRGLMVKAMEVRPMQRAGFFQDLMRSGFEAICIDYGENALILTLNLLFEEPGKDAGVMNPELVRAANGFYQNLAMNKAVPAQQSMMSRELYEAEYLMPAAEKGQSSPPMMRQKDGGSWFPVFTDMVEFARYDRKGQYKAWKVSFRELRDIAFRSSGVVVNPFGFGLALDLKKIDRVIEECENRGM